MNNSKDQLDISNHPDSSINQNSDISIDMSYLLEKIEKMKNYQLWFKKYFIFGMKLGLFPTILFFIFSFPPFFINKLSDKAAYTLFYISLVTALYLIGIVATLPFASIVMSYHTGIALGYSKNTAIFKSLGYGPEEQKFVSEVLRKNNANLSVIFENILNDKILRFGNKITIVFYVVMIFILFS